MKIKIQAHQRAPLRFTQHSNHERFESAVAKAQRHRHYPGGWKPTTNTPHSGAKQLAKSAARTQAAKTTTNGK